MSKYNYNYELNDYKTPPELYEMALDFFKIKNFTIDTCCTEENIPAKLFIKKNENDGLKINWFGYCWCNPPFNECKKWIEKAYKENKENGVKIAMLIPVRTETKYWHDYILFNPRVRIWWLRKGYKFLNRDNEPMGVFKNALALIYFNA